MPWADPMRGSLSCRGRVAYGMSLSKPTLPLSGANRVQQCLNKLKVRAGWLALKGRTAGWGGVRWGEGGGVAKSQRPQRLWGPQRRTMAPGLRGLALKSWAVFDRGDLFSVGLYMVAPCLAEGPRAMWQISAKDRKREREREIQGRDLGSEKPRSISNQDNCHVPGAGFSLPSLALQPRIQIRALRKSHSLLKDLLCLIWLNSTKWKLRL